MHTLSLSRTETRNTGSHILFWIFPHFSWDLTFRFQRRTENVITYSSRVTQNVFINHKVCMRKVATENIINQMTSIIR